MVYPWFLLLSAQFGKLAKLQLTGSGIIDNKSVKHMSNIFRNRNIHYIVIIECCHHINVCMI